MSQIQVPKGWEMQLLEQISVVERGISWKKSDQSKSKNVNNIPVLRIGNIKEKHLDLSDLIYLNGLSEDQYLKNKVFKDDILLVSSNGNLAYVGRACKITESMEFVFASFLSAIKNVLPNMSKIGELKQKKKLFQIISIFR